MMRTRAARVSLVWALATLLRTIPGKILVIWDGSPIHRSQAVKECLKRGAAKRLRLERLPGYAPDLNPEEGIWSYLKRVELATSAVGTTASCAPPSFGRGNDCATNGRSSGPAPVNVATWVSSLSRGQ